MPKGKLSLLHTFFAVESFQFDEAAIRRVRDREGPLMFEPLQPTFCK